jgi:hypothetical protein
MKNQCKCSDNCEYLNKKVDEILKKADEWNKKSDKQE